MPPFNFKQFSVQQDEATWKVGTDSILLGAWCNVHLCETALDAGGGTGLLALMLAQRNAMLKVTAVEIDAHSAGLAARNFIASPWVDRLESRCADLNSIDECRYYDLIVSNPPYFAGGLFSPNQKRRSARNGNGFDHFSLVDLAAALLKENGLLATIIPYGMAENLVNLAVKNELHLLRRTDVRHSAHHVFSRSLIELRRGNEDQMRHTQLDLYDGQYASPDYASLIAPFRDEKTLTSQG